MSKSEVRCPKSEVMWSPFCFMDFIRDFPDLWSAAPRLIFEDDLRLVSADVRLSLRPDENQCVADAYLSQQQARNSLQNFSRSSRQASRWREAGRRPSSAICRVRGSGGSRVECRAPIRC